MGSGTQVGGDQQNGSAFFLVAQPKIHNCGGLVRRYLWYLNTLVHRYDVHTIYL